MNYSNRIIPLLLISDDDLVKTVKFKKPIYLGDPVNTAKIFNDKEVDELIVVDISAQKNNKPPPFKIIEEIASECFMPLTYGGGINNFEIVERLFYSGIEKVSIQEQNFKDFELVKKISNRYGSQSVVMSIDVKKNFFNSKKVYRSSSSKYTKLDLIEFAKKGIDNGVGEILLTSVDHEGMMNGLDYELINQLSSAVDVPVIAHGGIGSIEQIKKGFKCGANAVAVGSFFVFQGPLKGVLISYLSEEEINKIFKDV
jgi:cyclase